MFNNIYLHQTFTNCIYVINHFFDMLKWQLAYRIPIPQTSWSCVILEVALTLATSSKKKKSTQINKKLLTDYRNFPSKRKIFINATSQSLQEILRFMVFNFYDRVMIAIKRKHINTKKIEFLKSINDNNEGLYVLQNNRQTMKPWAWIKVQDQWVNR